MRQVVKVHKDDIVSLNHSYGCGVAINAPDAFIPIRSVKNLSLNPNLGGEERTAVERLDIRNDLVLFNPAPVT